MLLGTTIQDAGLLFSLACALSHPDGSGHIVTTRHINT